MCGYNPFWLIESILDEEYKERTGENNMKGFQQAQSEYERHLTSLYDEDGALYEDEDELTMEDYLEQKAEYMMDEIQLERAFG